MVRHLRVSNGRRTRGKPGGKHVRLKDEVRVIRLGFLEVLRDLLPCRWRGKESLADVTHEGSGRQRLLFYLHHNRRSSSITRTSCACGNIFGEFLKNTEGGVSLFRADLGAVERANMS